MVLRQIRIGSLNNIHQYDDGDYDKSIEVDDPIKCNAPPVNLTDVLRLEDLSSVIAAFLALKAPIGLETFPTLSEAAGVISITGNHRVWIYGVLYEKTSTSVDLSALANGVWYIYYDTSGNIQRSQTIWSFFTSVQIAIVYKNGANYFIFDERHSTLMDVATHNYLHYTRGTAWSNGLIAIPADTTLNLGNGEFEDEDLRFQITGANPYQVRVFYRDASLNWLWTALQNNWWKAGASGRPQWDNAGTLTDLASGRYGVYFLVAINGYSTKIITFMGQGEYTTLAQARAALYGGMSFGTLPTPEIKALYKIIVRATPASGAFEEVQDLRANPQLVGSAPVLTDHGTLSGLSDSDHPASAIINTPAGTISSTDVQGAINELDTEKTTLFDVKADADIADAISKKHARSHAISSTSDHSDVNLAGIADKDLMQWDDPSSKWLPKSAAEVTDGVNITPGTITAGGLITANGGQIKFPATAVPSADVNTLDDYEEGSFTATLTCGTSGTITLDAGGQTLFYTKIGRKVTITGFIYVSSVSSPVGTLSLGTLPFTSGASSGNRSAGSILGLGFEATATGLGLKVDVSTTSVEIFTRYASGSASSNAADVKANTYFYLSLTYFV